MADKKTGNKIYGSFDFRDNNVSSRVRTTHENLISVNTANEFNTYKTWSSFGLAADVDPLTKDDFEIEGKDSEGNDIWRLKAPGDRKKVQSQGVRSIFNKFNAVALEDPVYGWRISQNAPLLDSPSNRQRQRAINACTVRDLVQKSRIGMFGTAGYDYSDFMYCKYLGRVPNNHLITLRRYAIPVTDYVTPYGDPAIRKIRGTTPGSPVQTTVGDAGGSPMGTMVTWLGTPGNEIGEILKYNFSMPFKSVDAKFENDGSPGGMAIDRTSKGSVGKSIGAALGDQTVRTVMRTITPGIIKHNANYDTSYPGPNYEAHKAYAGVDMIKSIYVRDGEKGLQFKHSFKLTFDYELKSYDGINGKQAMLDLLGNVLSTCYTSGDFWPGAYRHTAGGNSMQPLSSLECMQQHGTFSGYVKAFQHDFQTIKGKVQQAVKDPIGTLMNLLDNLGGMLLGGELVEAPHQMQQAVNSLLSDAAVGFWHITVGNPCAPILCMGNMIMTDCQVEHYGPLGIDDFPTGLRVTCTFEHGKPRDKRLIERMYIGGNDRIYMPLDQTVIDALNHAEQLNSKQAREYGGAPFKQEKANAYAHAGNNGVDPTVEYEATYTDEEKTKVAEAIRSNPASTHDAMALRLDILTDIDKSSLVYRVFGTPNEKSVLVASGEQADGNPVGQTEAKVTH